MIPFSFSLFAADDACPGPMIIYEDGEIILSPNDSSGDRYPNNADCSWLIVAYPGQVGRTQFNSIQFNSIKSRAYL